MSGILMAYKIQKHLKSYVDFQILEKSPELGGTWYENRYPGCACDVPSHCYQFSFAPNPDWSKFYASSKEIQAYMVRVARHFDLERYIKYNSKVVSARWSDSSSTWTVQTDDGSMFESELLVNAGGILNHPQYPNVAGLDKFAGPLLHTADWDDSINLEQKTIGVIGAGASAVQLLPKLQPLAKKIYMYIRTPSYIAPAVAVPDPTRPDQVYYSEEKEEYRNNREHYLAERKNLESQFNGMFRAFFKGTQQQADLRSKFENRMKELIKDESLQKKLIPTFEAGCRRINPGEQYLISLQEPNVEPIFDGITSVTSNGIISNGTEHAVDVLVAATGFNTTFKPRFPIFGQGGTNLQDLWADEPSSYLGTGVSGFPNYFTFLGPNTPISNGSALGPIEATGDYFIRLFSKMIRQRVRCVDIRPEAQNDFDKHTQTLMKDTVWTGTCRSWFKKGTNGKVTAIWPGSSLHYMQCLAEDRWEDYYWQYDTERYAYWGQGISWIENLELDPLGLKIKEYHSNMTTIPDRDSDLSFYLHKDAPIPLEAASTASNNNAATESASIDITGEKISSDSAQKEGSVGSDSGVGISNDGELHHKASIKDWDATINKLGDDPIVVPV
ncbi:unnamed protein product [Clonostachys rosea f. rosea IK726]|uniref:L-ornithine N(5)-oxygenase n=2 Tax=Bionectria ochroleuca TaxID=29856 RepID=A0A0B7KRI2_BIOOC|nr:unnamed protein product [Clonostachys rosea f. rosea IK726]